jgi:hypothetical protein
VRLIACRGYRLAITTRLIAPGLPDSARPGCARRAFATAKTVANVRRDRRHGRRESGEPGADQAAIRKDLVRRALPTRDHRVRVAVPGGSGQPQPPGWHSARPCSVSPLRRHPLLAALAQCRGTRRGNYRIARTPVPSMSSTLTTAPGSTACTLDDHRQPPSRPCHVQAQRRPDAGIDPED